MTEDKVKRYHLRIYDYGDTSEYVLHTDYQALEKRVGELEDELEKVERRRNIEQGAWEQTDAYKEDNAKLTVLLTSAEEALKSSYGELKRHIDLLKNALKTKPCHYCVEVVDLIETVLTKIREHRGK